MLEGCHYTPSSGTSAGDAAVLPLLKQPPHKEAHHLTNYPTRTEEGLSPPIYSIILCGTRVLSSEGYITLCCTYLAERKM